ncbi:hypothetical protein [Streptomyces massasporeus]|uniref:hypothetical protein n=1 Tax=Streptomyces massasporeus TaxID=67324 RepID=UPI00331F257E
MSDTPLARPPVAKAVAILDELPEHAREMVRDVLDIGGRDPCSFPPFDARDPEGEAVRSASVGQLTVVYWINRPAGRLYIDWFWTGRGQRQGSTRVRRAVGMLAARGRCGCSGRAG